MQEDPTLLADLVEASRRMVPDDLPGLVRSYASRLGADDALLYLVDLDQRNLVALSGAEADPVDDVSVDGTLAGRCFRSVGIVESRREDAATTVWIPVVAGTERVGVLQLVFARDRPPVDAMLGFAGILAELVVTKGAYGDYFACARRSDSLTVGSELLWQLLPPLTFAVDDLVIAAAFVPTARLGGDAFDYGVDHTTATVAIFDALGHDLDAGLLATTAVAAFRNARRSKFDLAATAEHVGDNISEHFAASKFVTGIVASLELTTGRFSWCSAGHPWPLLIRNARVVKRLASGSGQPFGVGPASEVLVEQLEPGDRVLLYTDGVTETRDVDGELIELEQLVDLLSHASRDEPPPEAIRLLMHAIEARNHGAMRDDATVVLVEWRGAGGRGWM
jgi:hypothetical protein